MLHKKTVGTNILELLNTLMLDDQLKIFDLVGGTALSLRIGHRISIDLDLFSETGFNEKELEVYLHEKYSFTTQTVFKNVLMGNIGGIKVDFITHPYPSIKPVLEEESIRMKSLEDIAAMKFNAIIGSGKRLKDFVDVAYLSSYLSLNTMLESYALKYDNSSDKLPLKALLYHNDIDHHFSVNMVGKKYSWLVIEKRLQQMAKDKQRVFGPLVM